MRRSWVASLIGFLLEIGLGGGISPEGWETMDKASWIMTWMWFCNCRVLLKVKLSRVLAKTRFYKEVHGRPCWEGLRGLTKVEVSSEPQAGAEECC